MLDTLLAVKARLESEINYLATKSTTEKAIYIMTDRVIPEISGYPAIGLKDGTTDIEYINGLSEIYPQRRTLEIKVTVFVEMLRVEEIVTGDGTEKGILEVAADVRQALEGFNPTGDLGFPMSIVSPEEGSYVLEDKEGGTVMVQAKDIVFQHVKDVLTNAP